MTHVRDFEEFIYRRAAHYWPQGFDVSENSPSTYEGLIAEHEARGRITVWSGGSRNTIFSSPKVNWAFRAWHDAKHIFNARPFTLEGELLACEDMLDDIAWNKFPEPVGRFQTVPRSWARLTFCEVVGQAEYFAATGKFPTHQARFAAHWLADQVNCWRADAAFAEILGVRVSYWNV